MPMLMTLRIRLPVWPFQAPLRTRSAKAAIRSSTAWTSGTTSSPSTRIDAPSRRAQRHVQHGALLGDVDLLAAEHRVDALAQPDSSASSQQQLQRLVGDAVLRVVEIDAGGLDASAARRAPGRPRRARAGAGPTPSGGAPSRAFQAGRCRSGAAASSSARQPWSVLPTRSGALGLLGLACLVPHAALLDAMTASSSFQESTKALRPFVLQCRGQRLHVDARLGESAEQRPRSRRHRRHRRARLRPWSANAFSVLLRHRVDGERRRQRLDVERCRRPSGPSSRCWPTAAAAVGRRRCSARCQRAAVQQLAVRLVASAGRSRCRVDSCSGCRHLAGHRHVPAADEHRGHRGDVGRIEPGRDAALDAAHVGLGRRQVLLAENSSVTLIGMPAKIASSMAGSPSGVPGILMKRFGRAARACSSFAAASVLAVS